MITQESNYRQQAKDKLNKEYKECEGDAKIAAMKSAVKDALLIFIEQDNEFAQAIVQGGSFSDCMKAVAKGVGSSISDIDAYKRAVQFYFKGADISFIMTIKVNPHEDNNVIEAVPNVETELKSSALSLSLDDLF